MKDFIEVTERWYDHTNNEYKIGEKVMININHIFKFGEKWIKTIEDVKEAPSLVLEIYEQIKNLIKESQP